MAHFESSPRTSVRMWLLAALGSAVLHFAGFVTVWDYLREDDPDPDFGAVAVEIGIDLLAPRNQPTDVPPGPDADESVPSPPLLEQSAVLKPMNLFREVPVQTESAELIATPVETKEIKEDKSINPEVPINPSVSMIATQATARPTSEVMQESTRSVALEQGTGESSQRVRATWQRELIAHFDRHKRYPASHSLESAEILVNFVLDETGRVLSSKIVRGSGEISFDEAALAMIRRSDPVPRPPAVIIQEGLSFTLPVIFRVKHVN